MTRTFWHGRRVLVTGASGFIGSHLVDAVVASAARVTATTSTRRADGAENLAGLRPDVRVVAVDLTRLDDCLAVCAGQQVVFSVAHADGSLEFKRQHPACIFRQNMLMTLNLLEAARECGVERVVLVSSAEVYSPNAPSPTHEGESFGGLEDRPLDGYAWSKRMTEFAGRLWAAEHGLSIAVARPNNVYGPRDDFDLSRGRVVPSMIRTIFDGREPIVIWGDGRQVRTFLYVEDFARGLVELAERAVEGAVNFAGNEEITIAELAARLIRLAGRHTEVVCDGTRPSGPARRTLDLRRAETTLGFRPAVSLETGLRRTIEAYLASAVPAAARDSAWIRGKDEAWVHTF